MNAAKSLVASLLLAAASLAPAAQASVINFNDMTGPDTIRAYGTQTLTTDGFTFKGTSSSYVIGSDYNGNNDRGFSPYNGTDFYLTYAATTLASATASAFKLNSIDVAMWGNYGAGRTATLTGAKVGGGFVTQTVDLNPLANFSNLTGNDFTNYSLVGFDNLSSVTITHNYIGHFAMDNFVVNAASVPEPSSLALFGLVVAAGAFARRRAGKAS
jgi:hypothetical protein